MNRICKILATIILAGLFTACQDQLVLTRKGESSYQIVLPENAKQIETEAAQLLASYINKISGAQLPIVKESQPATDNEILIGKSSRLKDLGFTFDTKQLQEDGFTIQTKGNHLIILGGTEKGALYGVTSFLENHLGCRKYTSKVEKIPSTPTIKIGEIKDTQIPAITFREVLYRDTYDKAFSNWHKLDTHGDWGALKGDWGYWCHSFQQLVSPEVYGKTHPEYFAYINGKRHPGSQLCLSNPEVLEIAIRNLKKAMDEKPHAKYWSVSQNDNQNYCQCPKCAAIDKEEGSPMGSVLRFVNKVAEHFPDKVISTLAYQYTRSVPAKTKPASNVNIMLCNIECLRHMPIADDPASASFCKDIQDWGRITDNILMWDYVIQFKNLVSPFPNLHTLQPNVQFLVKNNVSAIFEQGNREIGGEFAELRGYLLAKLLWNPNLDLEATMEDFLSGYYGAAGSFIRQYITIQEEALKNTQMKLDIFGNPVAARNTYLSGDLMKQYNSLFEKAEKAVADQPDLLQRVRIARLPLMYAELEIARCEGTGPRGLYDTTAEGTLIAKETIKKKLKTFVQICNQQGVTRIKEWSTTPDDYMEAYSRVLKNTGPNLAYGKPVTYITQPSAKYTANGSKTLTDGLRGSYDFAINWQGYEGKHMQFVVDLEEKTTIKSVSMDFLQATNDWVFLPKGVTYYYSNNGKKYFKLKQVQNPQPENKKGIFIQPFKATFDPLKARYIKVMVNSQINCPIWHMGAGGPAWLFTDEITVQ